MFGNIFAPSARIVPVTEPNLIRVSYNNEKCYKCNKNTDLTPITNDGEPVSFCKNCKTNVLLYEYIPKEQYLKNIKNALNVRINTNKFEDFLNSSI
jgi:hypothetical protein